MLASLNHPGIAAIYGIEKSDDTQALVLELVEGPTLADRIATGPIPLDEALPIAKQIAAALEAAHEAGVIHRDLKPANIKVREDGTVKVLDFGLAKALDTTPAGDPSQSPTLTAAATQMGVIMGTAAYMSPEQARGKTVDKRADIWAFGCVLYEMLTGRRAFDGEDVSTTLADVIRADLAWDVVPKDLPPALGTYLRRCLEKDPTQRVRDIGDVRLAIEGGFETDVGTSAQHAIVRPLQLWQRPLPAALVALLLVALGGLVAWNTTRPTPRALGGVARFAVELPTDVPREGVGGGSHTRLAVSADGTWLVYAGVDQLYVRGRDQLDFTPLQGTDRAVEPFFSPDGQWVGFWADGQLRRVSVTGGLPTTLAESERVWGAQWNADGIIIFSIAETGIARVPAAGGTPEVLVATTAGDVALQGPQLLPGGEWVLYSTYPGRQVVVQSLVSGERQVVIDDGASAKYLPSGHLVYVLNGTLRAAPFDVAGRPAISRFGPARRGSQPGSQRCGALRHRGRRLARVSCRRNGRRRADARLGRSRWADDAAVGRGGGAFLFPRLSPDGRHVAFGRFRNSGGQEYVLHPGTGPGVRGGSRWPGGTAPGCESPRPVS